MLGFIVLVCGGTVFLAHKYQEHIKEKCCGIKKNSFEKFMDKISD